MEFNKRVLVAGTGKSGIYAAKLLLERGAKVVLFDENENTKEEQVLLKVGNHKNVSVRIGQLDEKLVSTIDLVVLSPGISFEAPFTDIIRAHDIPIWSEIELAYQASSGDVAAITGTNGKTTTTSLVGEICKAYYEKVFVVGNIGIPYTEVANQISADAKVVAEISSFQLETIVEFHPHVSAILNITPDHLDRHHTLECYIDTKRRITMNQNKEDYCVLNYDDPCTREMSQRILAKPVYFSRIETLDEGIFLQNGMIVLREKGLTHTILALENLKLLGNHNVENVMASVAIAYYMGVPIEIIEKVCTSFMGVEHRIEYVDTVGEVSYYNDSKGTNPDAAIKGIQAMNRPTLLIGGGYDKHVPFDEWIQAFDGKVRYLFLIGQTANTIADTARKYGFESIIFEDNLEAAVKHCAKLANPGDAVLLSPACASWGQFDNYEQRGEMFKQYVRQLGE